MSLYLYPIFISKIAAIFIGILHWRFLLKPYRYAVLQVFLILLVELIGYYLDHVKHLNNIFLFNFYNLIEAWLLAFIGMKFLSVKFRNAILYALVLLTLYWIYCLNSYGIDVFFNWFFVIYCFFIVVLFISVLFTNALFTKKKVIHEPLTLFCIAIVLYYGSTIPLFGIMNYLIKSDVNSAARLFYISHTIEIIRYLLIAFAFHLHATNTQRMYMETF